MQRTLIPLDPALLESLLEDPVALLSSAPAVGQERGREVNLGCYFPCAGLDQPQVKDSIGVRMGYFEASPSHCPWHLWSGRSEVLLVQEKSPDSPCPQMQG